MFKAPRHVDIHNTPLRYCLVACNNSNVSLTVCGRPWHAHGSEMFLYHGDVLTDCSGGSTRIVVNCAVAPWSMPVLPPYERRAPAPPCRPPPSVVAAEAIPTHLEHMLGLQACA